MRPLRTATEAEVLETFWAAASRWTAAEVDERKRPAGGARGSLGVSPRIGEWSEW